MKCFLIVWLFCASGLCVANSKSIKDFEVSGDNVWVCFADKVVKYNRSTGEKLIYSSEEIQTNAYNFELQSIGCYGDSIYVGSSNGLFLLDEGKFTECQRGYMQKILAVDEYNDDLWLTGIGGVLKMDEASETFWECGALMQSSSQVIGLAFDTDGNVWVTERNTGLCKISGGQLNYMEDYSKVTWRAGWLNGKIAVDVVNQCVWEAQYLGGELRRYNMKDSVITVESKEDGIIPVSKAYDVMLDKDNTLWVASDNMLVRHKDGKNDYFSTQEGHSLVDLDIDDEGNVWCATTDGYLLVFDGNNFQYIDLFAKSSCLWGLAQHEQPVIERDGSALVLSVPMTDKMKCLRIYDVSGKLIDSQVLSPLNFKQQVNLSTLTQNEVYVIELETRQGRYTEKIFW